MSMLRRVSIAAGIVIAAALAVACTAPMQPGPIADTQARTVSCLPTKQGDASSFGAANWSNPTDEPLIIDSVTLVDSDGLTLVGAMTVPNPGDGHGGGVGAGSAHGYPLENDPAIGYTLDFARQQTVPGAVLLPGVQTDLIVGIRRDTNSSARSSAVRVAYHSLRQSYLFDIPASYVLPDPIDDCSAITEER